MQLEQRRRCSNFTPGFHGFSKDNFKKKQEFRQLCTSRFDKLTIFRCRIVSTQRLWNILSLFMWSSLISKVGIVHHCTVNKLAWILSNTNPKHKTIRWIRSRQALILGLRSTNEIRCNFLTTPVIGWVQAYKSHAIPIDTHEQPCMIWTGAKPLISSWFVHCYKTLSIKKNGVILTVSLYIYYIYTYI